MAIFEIRSAKITDRASEEVWSQVHVFTPLDARGRKRRGHVWAVFRLELGANRAISLIELGRELISRFHEEYYGKVKEAAGPALTNALTKINQELPEGIGLEVVAAVLIEDRLVIGISGAGQAYLCRSGHWAKIAFGNDSTTGLFTGQIQAEDWLVVGSGDFWQAVSESVLKSTTLTDFERVTEALSPLVCGLGKGAPAGVLVTFRSPETVAREPVLGTKKRHFGLLGKSFLRTRHLEYLQVGGAGRLKKEPSQRGAGRWGLLIFVLVVFGSVFFFRFSPNKGEDDFAGLKNELVRLGQLALSQPEQSRTEIEALSDEVARSSSEDLKRQYAQVLGAAWREVKVEELELFFDLQLIEVEARPSEFFISGSELVVLDQSGLLAYRIGEETGRGEPLLLGGSEKAVSLAGDGQKLFFLTRQGVGQVGKEGLLREEELTGEEKLAVFAGNLYWLEPASWEIYRIVSDETGYLPPTRWLQEVVRQPGRPLKIIVDGEVWVLDDAGAISRLNRGTPTPFGLELPRQPLVRVIDLAVTEERLFVLEETGQRLVVFDRSGKYLEQYSWPVVQAEKLAVSNEGTTAWLMSGTKIFRLGLK